MVNEAFSDIEGKVDAFKAKGTSMLKKAAQSWLTSAGVDKDEIYRVSSRFGDALKSKRFAITEETTSRFSRLFEVLAATSMPQE